MLYDPNGKGLRQTSDRELRGIVREIQGVEWALFPRYGNFGIPITGDGSPACESDLELAKSYEDVESYELSSDPFPEETAP